MALLQQDFLPSNPLELVTAGTRETALFGSVLAFALFSVFLFPILACWVLAFDVNVSFWFGRYIFWWTLPVPFFFLFVVFRQIKASKPKRGLLLATWICPCVLIFILAGILNSQTSHLADRLVSKDCRTFPTIRPISQSYWRAKDHLDACLSNQTYYLHSMTVFNACPKYKEWYKQEEHPEYWDYLHYLEDNYECSGFCVPVPGGVWSLTDSTSTKDSCSKAVVAVLHSKIIRITHQLMATPMVILFGVLVWVFAVRPTFQAYYLGRPDPAKATHQPQHPYYGTNGMQPPLVSSNGRFSANFAPAPLPSHMRTLPPTASIPGSLPPGAMIPGGFAPASSTMPAGYRQL